MRMLLIALLCVTGVGCTTRYQEMGYTGGVTADQMTADTWRIVARGNAYTSKNTVQDYVLLKAAETTRDAGGSYFQVLSSGDASNASTLVTPGSSTTTVAGRGATTTTSPGSFNMVIRPGQEVYIRVLQAAPIVPTAYVFSAAEIIQAISPRAARPS
jgi:hypothetical protein